MDAFENIIATIMDEQGFWTRTAFKVELTKEEKREIGRASSPRWEIDVIAYRPGDNILRVIECKSYLDSRGVDTRAFDPTEKFSRRFKLFNEPKTREVVFRRLVTQLSERGSVAPDPTIKLCLAAGKIVNGHTEPIRERFEQEGWELFDPTYIRTAVQTIADGGYDNSIAAVTAKLLLR